MRGVGAPDKRSSAPRSEGCGSAHFPRVLRPIAHPRPLPLSVITPNYCLRARRVWANVSAESNYDIPTRSGPGVLLLVSGDEGPRRANCPVCSGKKDNIIRIRILWVLRLIENNSCWLYSMFWTMHYFIYIVYVDYSILSKYNHWSRITNRAEITERIAMTTDTLLTFSQGS